jgi:hypothetical protein
MSTNLDLDNLSANLRAHKDYTRAVIAERDTALKECEEQARLLGMSALTRLMQWGLWHRMHYARH